MTAQLKPQDREAIKKLLQDENKKAALSVLQLLQKQVSHTSYVQRRG